MTAVYFILFVFSLYWLIPKATALHEILRLPGYNYRAIQTRRNEMLIKKYRFGSHRKQYLVLFLPKDGKVTRDKVIIYYHGGGWTFGTPMMFRCNAQRFVDQGYAVIMPSYRRLPFYRASAMKADAQAALKKSVDILEQKGWSDKEIILSGLSSGGHLAALIAYQNSTWNDLKIPKNRLAGLMFFAAPLDLYAMANTPVIWRLAGRRGSDFFNQANPTFHLTQGDSTPLFLIHGKKDGLVKYGSSLSFVEKRGMQNLTFYTIEGGTHLDGGNWIFEDGEIRKMVMEWLEK